jgi:hypothetical protein
VQLDTFDEGDLIKLSRKLGEPPLVTGPPPLIEEQLELTGDPFGHGLGTSPETEADSNSVGAPGFEPGTSSPPD